MTNRFYEMNILVMSGESKTTLNPFPFRKNKKCSFLKMSAVDLSLGFLCSNFMVNSTLFLVEPDRTAGWCVTSYDQCF